MKLHSSATCIGHSRRPNSPRRRLGRSLLALMLCLPLLATHSVLAAGDQKQTAQSGKSNPLHEKRNKGKRSVKSAGARIASVEADSARLNLRSRELRGLGFSENEVVELTAAGERFRAMVISRESYLAALAEPDGADSLVSDILCIYSEDGNSRVEIKALSGPFFEWHGLRKGDRVAFVN